MLGLLIPWWGRWAALAVLILASMAFGAAEMRKHDNARYDVLAVKFNTFKSQVATAGMEAQAKAKAQAAADKRAKEQADNENQKTITSLRTDIKRLRDSSARGSYVPAAPAGAVRPGLACFDRPQLERAIRDLVAEVRGLVDEGSETTVDLDTAKRWAQDR